MRTFKLALIAFAMTSFGGIGLARPSPSGTWPFDPAFIPTSGGSYTVPQSGAVLKAPILRLPAHFLLRFDPAIKAVSWTVGRLEFGEGAVIDLSPTAPGRAGRDTNDSTQSGVSAHGGVDGANGADGQPAVSLTAALGSIAGVGSLWIRTDGGKGGRGGDGTGGKSGRNGSCGWGLGGKFKGGNGGNGGRGGKGGRGGDSAVVSLAVASPPTGEVKVEACGSNAPPPDVRNDGRIVISGSPGEAGDAGSPGKAGTGGLGSRCLIGVDVGAGLSGRGGHIGNRGEDGRCPNEDIRPIQVSGALPLASISQYPRWDIIDGSKLQCGTGAEDIESSDIRISGNVSFECTGYAANPPPNTRLAARSIVFENATIHCAPRQNLWFAANVIEWKGKVRFECSGQDGSNGSDGTDAPGNCWADSSKNKLDDYIAAKIFAGGDAGNGGDGWSGSDLHFEAARQLFSSGATVVVKASGGHRGMAGKPGKGGSKAFAPNPKACDNGGPFTDTAKAPGGRPADDGVDGPPGWVTFVGDVVDTPSVDVTSTVGAVIFPSTPQADLSEFLTTSNEVDRERAVKKVLDRAIAGSPKTQPVPPSWHGWAGTDQGRAVQSFLMYRAETSAGRHILFTSGHREADTTKRWWNQSAHSEDRAVDGVGMATFGDRLREAWSVSKASGPGFSYLMEEVDPAHTRADFELLLKRDPDYRRLAAQPRGTQMNIVFKNGVIMQAEIGDWMPMTKDGKYLTPFHATKTSFHFAALCKEDEETKPGPNAPQRSGCTTYVPMAWNPASADSRPVPRSATAGTPLAHEPAKWETLRRTSNSSGSSGSTWVIPIVPVNVGTGFKGQYCGSGPCN